LKPRIIEEQLQSSSGQETIVSDEIPEDSSSLSPIHPKSKERYIAPSKTSPEHGYSGRHSRPTTPSDWSPSVRGIQVTQDPLEDEAASDHELQQEPLCSPSFRVDEKPLGDDFALANTFATELSSYPSPPTPAQRPKPYAPLLASSPLSLSPSFITQTPNAEPPFLPTSTQSTSIYTRRKVMRKVPHPVQPLPLKSSISGSDHILVPNSDTSGTASQSQPHSQSQSASQTMLMSTSIGAEVLSQNFTGADSDTENKDKVQSDEDQVDELQDEGDEWQVEQSHSIVSDSQEDQLDEDDAQIDQILFGRSLGG